MLTRGLAEFYDAKSRLGYLCRSPDSTTAHRLLTLQSIRTEST